MGKARDQIPAPVVTPPGGPCPSDGCEFAAGHQHPCGKRNVPVEPPAPQLGLAAPQLGLAELGGQIVNPEALQKAYAGIKPAPAAGAVAREAAIQSTDSPNAFAAAYAEEAAHIARLAGSNPHTLARARRLLRLALAHLEL